MPEEVETWMTAPTEEALKLQQPVPDGSLKIVEVVRRSMAKTRNKKI